MCTKNLTRILGLHPLIYKNTTRLVARTHLDRVEWVLEELRDNTLQSLLLPCHDVLSDPVLVRVREVIENNSPDDVILRYLINHRANVGHRFSFCETVI
jgi:hypothetical protein